jgi:hypothetical protein
MGGEHNMSIVVEEAPLAEQQVTENQEPEAVEAQQDYDIQEETEVEVTEPESIVPEKYAGKSLEEVIEMHQNAERILGKQGMEVGHQRKLIETLMSSQQQAPQATAPMEEPVPFEEQFYADPANAVNSAIEKHPDVVKAKETRAMQSQALSQAQLEAAHPDFKAIVESNDFRDWIGASKIRQELFRTADSYDFDAANELFTTWKQINMATKTAEVKKKEKVKRQKALQKTSSETRSSGDSVGGKKIYRRADLINLQVTDPTRYASLADEIQSAYAEGRVK